MSRPRMLQVCALSFDADPHPDGIYVRALNRASEFYVRARANDWAKITKPVKTTDENFLLGRILIWTEIDIEGKWLDTTSEDTLSEALKANISIPSEAKPNFRTFNYLFKISNHRLYFESLNEFNEGLGPKTARSIFLRLLSRELLKEKFPDMSVTILPNEKAVEKVLTLPGLRSLTIRINTPNADASDPNARKRVLDDMHAAQARQREEHWIKNSEAKNL